MNKHFIELRSFRYRQLLNSLALGGYQLQLAAEAVIALLRHKPGAVANFGQAAVGVILAQD